MVTKKAIKANVNTKKQHDENVLFASQVFKALSDPIRLQIINLISKEEKCVCQIERELHLPQNLVSYHLSILKKAKLITFRRFGSMVLYKADAKVVDLVLSLLKELTVEDK